LTTTLTTPHSLNHFDSFELAAYAANLADSKKSRDTLVLDVRHISHFADYFVICSAESPTQVRTMTDAIQKAFREQGLMPTSTERDTTSRWSLLDYGDIVIHIMHQQERAFYNLESFWSHGTPVPAGKWQNEGMLRAS